MGGDRAGQRLLEAVPHEVARRAHLAGDALHLHEVVGLSSHHQCIAHELFEELRLGRPMVIDYGCFERVVVRSGDHLVADCRDGGRRQVRQRVVEFGGRDVDSANGEVSLEDRKPGASR